MRRPTSRFTPPVRASGGWQPVRRDGRQSRFPVSSADDVLTDTLAVPDGVREATRIDGPSPTRAVPVARVERAARPLEWFTPSAVREPDLA